MCKCKSSIENETHIIEGNCETYSQIRNKYRDLETEDNLVAFFSEVLEERERLEEEERSPSGGGGDTMEDGKKLCIYALLSHLFYSKLISFGETFLP